MIFIFNSNKIIKINLTHTIIGIIEDPQNKFLLLEYKL